MKPLPTRLAAITGVTCAIAATGTVASAWAATPGAPTGTPLFPGLSCSVNQGMIPGIPNLGPTGPMGPLGPSGPLGNTNSNLPCGLSALNFGPSGPLGPGGALGTPPAAPQSGPAQPTSSPTQTSPAKPSTGRHTGKKHKHKGHRGKHNHNKKHRVHTQSRGHPWHGH
jgi:hypothetical protein